MQITEILNILSNTNDGVFAIGEDQKIVFWNKSAKKILGYSARDVIGKSCHEIIAGSDNKAHALCTANCIVRKSIAEGTNPRNFEIHTYTKSGVPVWIDVSTISIKHNRPDQNILVHMFRDITWQKNDLNIIVSIVSHINNSNRFENKYLPEKNPSDLNILTSRERIVLKYLGEGYKPADLSNKLHISLSTIRKHIQNIYSKLETHSLYEAVIKAREKNLI